MNTENLVDETLNALEDLQSFIRDYLNTTERNPEYSDVPRVIQVLNTIRDRLK